MRRAVRRDREHAARHARDVVVALARSESESELAALRRRLGRDGHRVGAGGLGDALLLLADLGDEVAARGAGLLLLRLVDLVQREEKKRMEGEKKSSGLKKEEKKRDSERASERGGRNLWRLVGCSWRASSNSAIIPRCEGFLLRFPSF